MPNLLTPEYDWVAYQQAEIDGSTFTLRAYGVYAPESTGSFELDAAPGVFPNGSTLSGDASWSIANIDLFSTFYLWLVVISENEVIYQQMIFAPGDPMPNTGSAPFFVEIPNGRELATIEIQGGNASGPNGASITEYGQVAEVTIVGGAPEPSSCFWQDKLLTEEDCDSVAIVFEEMAGGHVEGYFAGGVGIVGLFSGPLIGQGEFRGQFAMAGAGLFFIDYGSGEPEIPPTFNGEIFVGGEFSGFVNDFGDYQGGLHVAGNWSAGTAFDGALGITGGWLEFPEPAGFAILVEQDPALYAFAGVAFDSVEETIGMAPSVFSTPFAAFREQVRAHAAMTAGYEGIVRLQSGIGFDDALAVIVMMLVEENFDIDATPADNFTAVAAVADALVLSGVATTMLEAVNLIVSSLAFRDLAEMLAKEQLSDGITFDAAAANVLTAMAALVDTILAADQGEASALLGVVVGESLAAGDTATGALEAHQAIREGIALTLRLSLDSGQYVAYVLNTESKGLTTYQNYPFNSFAKVGGENGAYYGMTHDGIRLLEGPDDDGTAINGRIRLAFTNMGTGREKRMLAAYLGYTSTGALRLKAIVQDPASGQKHAHYYRLNAQPAAAPTAARVQIGQGLKSVYWAFEIEAIGGAEFMLDVVEMLPLVVETRVPGEGGGKR